MISEWKIQKILTLDQIYVYDECEYHLYAK